MPHFFYQSIIDGHLGWFQVFAIVNSAAMNIRVYVHSFAVPRSYLGLVSNLLLTLLPIYFIVLFVILLFSSKSFCQIYGLQIFSDSLYLAFSFSLVS